MYWMSWRKSKLTPNTVQLSSRKSEMLSFTLIRLLTWQPITKISCLSRVSTSSVSYHFICASSRLAKKKSAGSRLTNGIALRHLSDANDKKLFKADKERPIEAEKQMDLERIREMQKYFEQYVEEYVEMEPESVAPCKTVAKSDRLRQRLEPLLDFERDSSSSPFSVKEIVDILRAERSEDIVCIKVPVNNVHDRYVIICTPHNMRHGEAIVLAIRKSFKLKTNQQVQPPKKAKVGRWLCYTFENISLHIMTHEARLKYDLESLWGIGWMETFENDADILCPEISVY